MPAAAVRRTQSFAAAVTTHGEPQMSGQGTKVFRCKRCGTVIRRAEARQEHCYWHHITDKNVDAYFDEEDEAAEIPAGASGYVQATQLKSASGFGVLVVSTLILLAMAILYVAAN